MADYTLEQLDLRAAAARTAFAGTLVAAENNYAERTSHRRERRLPTLGVCGMGRAGKDTAAEHLCRGTQLVYPGSSSRSVLPFIAHMAGVPEEAAWESRHVYRQFWLQACHVLRGSDYTLLARLTLARGDIFTGCRGLWEFQAVVDRRVVDLTVWVENTRVPADPTVEFGRDDCDIVIENNGSRTEFLRRLDRLRAALRLTD